MEEGSRPKWTDSLGRLRDNELISDAEQVGVGDVVGRHERVYSDTELLGDAEKGISLLNGVERLVQNADVGGGQAGYEKDGIDSHDMWIGDRVAVEGDQFGHGHPVLIGDGCQGFAGADGVCAHLPREGGIGSAPLCARLPGGSD